MPTTGDRARNDKAYSQFFIRDLVTDFNRFNSFCIERCKCTVYGLQAPSRGHVQHRRLCTFFFTVPVSIGLDWGSQQIASSLQTYEVIEAMGCV